MIQSIIKHTGMYLPEKQVTNTDLETLVDTSDSWIQERTGIKKRHLAADNELTSDMAANAAKNALEHTDIDLADIDMIIVATTTPDRTFPATATKVQALLGLKQGFAFDIQAVCSGFVYALATADNFIKSGQVRNALVIGADKMSSIIDWNDRKTCVLFGDGAGAILLSRNENNDGRGILSSHLYSDGTFFDILHTDGGTGFNQEAGLLRMQGQEVYKHATQKMAACAKEALEHNNLTISDIDWLIPHQANLRILQSVAKKLKLDTERVITTVQDHANTSAASIPLALAEANKANKFQPNQHIIIEAIGGGLSWGSSLIRW